MVLLGVDVNDVNLFIKFWLIPPPPPFLLFHNMQNPVLHCKRIIEASWILCWVSSINFWERERFQQNQVYVLVVEMNLGCVCVYIYICLRRINARQKPVPICTIRNINAVKFYHEYKFKHVYVCVVYRKLINFDNYVKKNYFFNLLTKIWWTGQICMLGIVFHSSKKNWRINISGPWYYIGFLSPVCIYIYIYCHRDIG